MKLRKKKKNPLKLKKAIRRTTMTMMISRSKTSMKKRKKLKRKRRPRLSKNRSLNSKLLMTTRLSGSDPKKKLKKKNTKSSTKLFPKTTTTH